MFNLDEVNKVADYVIQYKGQTYTFDTVLIISKLAAKSTVTDPAELKELVNSLFGLSFSTFEALAVLRDFETFSSQFEGQLKNLFGLSQSSSATTDSPQQNAKGSQPDSSSVSDSTSQESTQ